MTEKRYFTIDYGEQYYIFDSNVISKIRVEEEVEYSYAVFGNSMSSDEIVDLLNKQSERISELEKQNKELIQIIKGISKDSADAISKLMEKSYV